MTEQPNTAHPRAQGAYTCPYRYNKRYRGSSPCAGSILLRTLSGQLPPRLIPVRREHTPGVANIVGGVTAHPRAQGAYTS